MAQPIDLTSRVIAILHESQTSDSKQLVSDNDYASAVTAALLEYSRFFPRQAVQAYRLNTGAWDNADVAYSTGDVATYSSVYYQCILGYTASAGSDTPDADATHWTALTNGTYEFLLPTDWIDSYSQILSLEYPGDEQDPLFMDATDFRVANGKWRFRTNTASAGDTAYLTYSLAHSESTVPAPHLEGVAKLAAANVAMELASKTNVTTNPRLPADVTDYRTKADVWRSIAKDLRAAAGVVLGVNLSSPDAGVTAPAAQTVQWVFARP